MIKILTAKQIREADTYTIKTEQINAIQLMERAAEVFVKQLLQDFPDAHLPICIFCGNGNNGGDGLAIAHMLLKKGHSAEIYLFPAQSYSKDYLYNLHRLQKYYKKKLHLIHTADFIRQLSKKTIIIDAIFGIGLNSPMQPGSLHAQIIEQINQQNFSQIISVDIPSGLFADTTEQNITIKALNTYTFQFPKLSFFLPNSGIYTNKFKVLNIDLHPEYIQSALTDKYLIEKNDIISRLRGRTKFSHKGNYGHSLIISGSFGKMGAAVLSGKAALRSGAGLVTAHIPACGYEIFQMTIPEAMCSIDKLQHFISKFPETSKYDAIAIGPGINTHPETIRALGTFLKQQQQPVILDADALNCIAQQRKILKSIPTNSILTPHPKEFERIVGKWSTDTERLLLQQNFSKEHHVIVILKGAYSSITGTDGTVYFNSTGNAGMATAGSGDVLTGILAGLLAQGYTPLDVAIIGVYLHGLAGDLALQHQSMESLIASDIIEHLGNAYKSLQ